MENAPSNTDTIKDALAKVPAVTLGFWIIKIIATTLGETAGDAVSMTWLGETTSAATGWGYLIGTAIFVIPLGLFIMAQIAARRFNPLLYWVTIIASTTAGTTLADFSTRTLFSKMGQVDQNQSYLLGSLLLYTCVIVTTSRTSGFNVSQPINTGICNMKTVFGSVIFGVALMAGLSVFTSASAQDIAALETRLDAEHKAGRFSGVAIISLDQKIIFDRSFGEINAQTHLIATSNTPWRLASITKQITAILVMQAIERGELGLDQTVGNLLPAFKGTMSGVVTVKQLLTHTSGFPDPSETPVNAKGVPAFYAVTRADHAYCAGTPRTALGEFHYNNCDYYVLSDILTAVTGKSYARLLRERISRPLGLKTVRLYGAAEKELFVATDDKGGVEPPYRISSFEAAAGLSGSASDLLAIDNALMSGKILKPESLKVLWNGEPNLGYVALGAWSYTVKPKGCSAPLTLVERRGAVGDVNVLNLMWPERKSAVVVFSNNGATDWGQLWQDSGLMRDLAFAAWCK